MICKAIVTALFTLAVTTPALALDPNGTWARGDGNARVRIAPCGSAICATNLWIKDPKSSEKVGDKLIMKLKPKGDNVLSGEAYDPQRKMSYAMEMRVTKSSLSTRGCIVGGLLCKSVSWSRL